MEMTVGNFSFWDNIDISPWKISGGTDERTRRLYSGYSDVYFTEVPNYLAKLDSLYN
jgi:hypothetical protein